MIAAKLNFVIVCFTLCLFKTKGNTTWSNWELSDSTWKRTKNCEKEFDCIHSEQTQLGCLGACINISSTVSHFNGFSTCGGFCHKGIHSRSIACNNKSCVVHQAKRCTNEKYCLGGHWESWTDYNVIGNKCDNLDNVYLQIRHCTLNNVETCDNASGGAPFQVEFRNCNALTTRPSSTVSLTTLKRLTTTTAMKPKKTCEVQYCLTWSSWKRWSSCYSTTNKRQRTRVCMSFKNSCIAQVITQAELDSCLTVTNPERSGNLNQQLVLILSLTMAGVVLLTVASFIAVKCYKRRRNATKQIGNDANVAFSSLPSPTYQCPIDTVHTARVVMTGDSIYASIN